MPQPRRVKGMVASKVVTLRLTGAEWLLLRRGAKAAGEDHSAFLRAGMTDRAATHGITPESLDKHAAPVAEAAAADG